MAVERIDVPGGHLAAEIDGDGPPVVLVHAGVADRRMWDGVVPALARRHRVIRPDLRGFGESLPASAPFSHPGDLVALMDALGVERAAFAASSYGGRVALDLAAAHPGRVVSLALLAAPLPGHDWSAAMREYDAEEEAALDAGDLDKAVDLNLDMWVRGPSREWDGPLRAHAERLRRAVRVSLENQRRSGEYERGAVPDLVAALPALDLPVLVAAGTRDLPDFADLAARLAATLPRAERVSLPGVGHLIPVEDPARTAELLLRHLSA
ncbi:alpha/beta hydrolase [Nonomuraea longicatena]|uniref:Alpha/beta hydrolase n=1 Tax=Nonomuraea longicatena TaxID=83682 RepID=A0ABP4AGU1_9ACTN